MSIELGHASAATKGQLNEDFPEIEALSGKICAFTFDDRRGGTVIQCPF